MSLEYKRKSYVYGYILCGLMVLRRILALSFLLGQLSGNSPLRNALVVIQKLGRIHSHIKMDKLITLTETCS